jgi:hypothetical protein
VDPPGGLLARNDIILCIGNDRVSWEIIGLGIVRLRKWLDSLPPRLRLTKYSHFNDTDIRLAVGHGRTAAPYDIRLATKIKSGIWRASYPRWLCSQGGLGLAQSSECQKLQDKIYGILGMTDFDMPIYYKRPMFDLYTGALLISEKSSYSVPMIAMRFTLRGSVKYSSTF